MKDSFSTYHPVINFLYFAVVIFSAMFFMHPVFLLISLSTGILYSILLNGKKAVQFNFLYMLPMLLFVAIINPLFSHRGVTILLYLNSNPITLESLVYGVAAAVMFVAVIIWFSCYNAIMSSDKFIYLFGRVIPALSLLFSMVLRFVPKFKAQLKVISHAQKCIGRDVSNGNILQKARHGLRMLSILTTWALENAVETADSMKSRGYGLRGRTSFSNYRFDKRDRLVLLLLLFLSLVVFSGAVLGDNTIQYFPMIVIRDWSAFRVIVPVAYAVLCLMPAILDGLEELKWRRLKSKN